MVVGTSTGLLEGLGYFLDAAALDVNRALVSKISPLRRVAVWLGRTSPALIDLAEEFSVFNRYVAEIGGVYC
jgi:hypothetical protein